jgi:glucose 1-dehydrogenase
MTKNDAKRLSGLVAIITGGGRGIGVALAKGLAREGAAVVVNYSRSGDAADAVVRDIVAAGGEAIAVQADVSQLTQHDRLISTSMNHFGAVDVLVNNAGIEIVEPFLTTTEHQFDRTLSINLKGVYFLCQKAAQAMIRAGRGGRIINISSCHDTVPLSLRSAYGVSKGGLGMLTKSLALELAEYNINVTAVSPGAILTDMNRESLTQPDVVATLLKTIPLNRVGEIEDCVGAVVFLASRDAGYVTGTTLYVDGGLLLRKY